MNHRTDYLQQPLQQLLQSLQVHLPSLQQSLVQVQSSQHPRTVAAEAGANANVPRARKAEASNILIMVVSFRFWPVSDRPSPPVNALDRPQGSIVLVGLGPGHGIELALVVLGLFGLVELGNGF